MSQVRMDCEARVSRYWPKRCRGDGNAPGGCVPADPNHNKSYYDTPNISPLAPKKWHISYHFIISLKQFGDLTNSLAHNRENTSKRRYCNILHELIISFRNLTTATAGSDVVQSGRPIFDDFFQHLWPYIGNNTANVVFQMVKRLWLIRIDQ
ncbi:uncharacterized protein TNCV_3117541 [Trichonephila clavipes]|uniref:Uncharacterized protein n=1 Tax=Trichonephila clavipes TaxID=2585209 RepID=A0A8X6W904_TRICX|nr:uncharacterized protein TNCV_3117541 [Trichonephila clavipes]